MGHLIATPTFIEYRGGTRQFNSENERSKIKLYNINMDYNNSIQLTELGSPQ